MKRIKGFLSIVLCLTMLLSTIPTSVFAVEGNTENVFAGGDGTAENPYQVSTPEQLDAVRYNLTAHYIQVNDIDMARFGNWNPIGRDLSGEWPAFNDDGSYISNSFCGTYNGNGHIISNLKIYDELVTPNSECYGLFSELEKASVSNISITDINYFIDKTLTDFNAIEEEIGFSTYPYCGGIAGWADASEIINCTVSGSITVRNCNTEVYVGGLTGFGGEIIRCTNRTNIDVASSYAECGGISGAAPHIEESYNYGTLNLTVISGTDCGGIIGRNYGTVERCNNYGNITCYVTNGNNRGIPGGNTHVGGIIGFAWEPVEKCVNYGNIISTTMFEELGYFGYDVVRSFVGGVAGYSIAGFGSASEWGSELHNNINMGKTLDSYRESSYNDGSVVLSNCGRIAGYLAPNSSNTQCYSLDSTLVNGEIPNDYISSSDINGVSLSQDEIVDLLERWSLPNLDEDITTEQSTIKYGADRFSFSEDIEGYAGDVIDSLVVYSSANENIASLDITSSNTDIVEIGTVEIGVGDYITSENEHKATIPLKLKAEGTSTITITSPEGVSESVKVTVSKAPEVEKSIAVFTTEKSLSVNTGDSMWLAFGLMNEDTGLVEEDWRKMAITVSDPTIISLSDYEETEYGYSLEVIGKKEGATNVTITDTETGINAIIVINVYDSFVQTFSYAIDDMKVFYPNNQWEDHIATNIYNLNGLYVNNYQCIKNGDTYNIDFDVYNSRYYAGSVDIYDESGMWLGYEEIVKYSDITSLWSTGEQAYYLISNTVAALIPGGNESNLLTYEQESFSKHTHISLQIPEGGYFTISNNIATSPGTFFINAFEILFDGAYTALDLVTSDSVKTTALSGFKKSAAKSLADRLIEARNEGLKNELRKKAQKVMLGTMQSEITKITKKFTQAELKDQLVSTDETCSEMANLAENILSSYNISWKHLFQTATGVGESFFTSLSGPAGVALKGCFAITKSTNKLLMATQMATSTQKPYVTVYSKIQEGYINPYGVIVNTAGNIDAEAVLQVFRVSNDDAVDVILNSSNPLEKHELYNICFVKDDQLVQPSGKVTVHIPIPEGMNSNTCKVYRQESDSAWTILDAHVEGNYLVFQTDHFSLYSVIGDMNNLGVHSLPNKVVYTDGDTLDTTGLVLDLKGELISEGFVCEPMVLSGVGNITITVQYGNSTTDFDVVVTNGDTTITPDPDDIIKGNSTSTVSWELNKTTGKLTFFGEGKLTNGYSSKETPWYYSPTNKYVKSVEITDGITSVNSFENCYNLEEVILASSVTTIEDAAFRNCVKLISINIHSGITNIGGSAFEECSSLSDITLPETIEHIGVSAFENTAYYNDSSNWTDGVLYINNYLIRMSEDYSGHFLMRDDIYVIADFAFSYCSKLTSVQLSNNIACIPERAFLYSGIENISIPVNVKTIKREAFRYCSLSSIDIGNGVTTIDENAFAGCNLTEIVLPLQIESIGEKAFIDCKSLIDITILSDVAVIGDYALGYYETPTYQKLRYSDYTTIYGLKDSAAEEYAKTNGITFFAADNSMIPGDIDGNGTVSTDDIVSLLLYISMPDMFPIGDVAADFTGDGEVATEDAVTLLLHISMPDLFPLNVGKKES